MPVKTDRLVITSPYGQRRNIFHNGVDLRSVNLETGAMLDIVAPEQIEVLRNGIDGYGNYFLVGRPMETPYKEIKFIHIDETGLSFRKGDVLPKGKLIGHSRIGGNSAAHHLHFEVWTDEAVDPVVYFETMGIKYKYA